ncbi:MAG: ATP synthase F1 subunit gamma [Clostridia bacterium]|nr:ATP synthase F1 subunit gamma [Clostridia bacterium]
MPNTKALRVRIKSVKSTEQLTKAMGLVASSKIRRANEAMYRAREYISSLEKSVALLTCQKESQKSPFMQKRDTSRTKIIIIAGDRGLAGGYNANIFRLAKEYPNAEFLPIGKRACERYAYPINSSERYTFDNAMELSKKLCDEFQRGEFDKLGIIYTKYHSVMTQEANIKWLLPLEKSEVEGVNGIIYEPDHLTVLNMSVREYIAGNITSLARESFACEVSARRMAMDSAGKNAKQMIVDLSLQYNRARQGAITQEITEIVAGAGDN